MELSKKQPVRGVRGVFWACVFLLAGTGVSLGQVQQGDRVYRYDGLTLSPVSTGRSVSFTIGKTRNQSQPGAFAVKTNVLYLATATPNLGLEFALGGRISLELSGGYHPWEEDPTTDEEGLSVEGKRLKHWIAKPELRYWLDQPFSGHFFGVNGIFGSYDLGGYEIPWLFEKDYYYNGDAYGGSLVYGYHWAFSPRWRVEFNVGVGMLQLKYDRTDCVDGYCAATAQKFKKTYFGPTQLGAKIVFMIK